MKDYYQITIPVREQSTREILIAQLAAAGYEGFEEETHQLKAFTIEEAFLPAELETLLSPFELSYSQQLVKQVNWNAEWEAGFSPVVVGDFCAVRAIFHEPVPGTTHELVITPKMSFGTGHHATTYLMIEAMSRIDFHEKSVLDFGTGTGVLAILAEKLGAASIVAIDNDPWSIDNGQENLLQNGSRRIQLHLAESIDELEAFDVILANINKNVILANIPVIKEHLKPGGLVLFSGLLTADFGDINAALLKNNYEIAEKFEKEGWICLLVSHIGPAANI